MQIIFIHELKVETIIGIHAWERQLKQLLCLDLELGYDMSQAVATDKVEFAVDYASLTEKILAFIQSSHFKLIETLADQVINLLLKESAIQWVRLKLTKPGALPQAKGVGVIIERSKV
ncbi:MAG: dihydroneopterin aldolase [Gammaproteobacteria bacterium]|jgi:dihydroneopterin aldolase|nr:dihydroneopterin aldolase [Gammaproteobacteria bacterium]